MLRAYLYKLIHSPLFYMSILGVVFLCSFQPALRWYRNQNFGQSVIFDMDYMMTAQYFPKIMTVLGSLPFAANFAFEWTNAVTAQCVTRCGEKKYAAANVLYCALSSLITVMSGMIIFALIYSRVLPLCDNSIINYPNRCHGALITSGFPVLYLLSNIFVFASSVAMMSVIGLMMSAFFPDKYIAVCTPLIANFAIIRVTGNCPPYFNYELLACSWFPMWDNPLLSILYTVGLFSLVTAVCGFVFSIIVKRRVRSEVA